VSRRLAVVALVLAFAPAGAAVAAPPRASLPDIEDEVMCLECGTPLSLSNAPVADRERAFIRREIARGRTKEQIKDALVDRFGPAVLAEPEDEGFGLTAYVVPVLVALLALLGVLAAARRWRRRPARAAAAPRRPDPADEQRLERELAAYDRGLTPPDAPPG
jgi:cytochrome c-type biogenesis protein CcmH